MSMDLSLVESLKTGFVDENNISLQEYQPKLLINDNENGKKVLTSLIEELKKCDEFFFSVAFITNSGVAVLINTLKELETRGVKGKIIASQYQNFTEPIALKRLEKLSNIKLRIVTEENLHAKGYIFKKGDKYTLIVGSSNLTQNALSVNKEWNIKVTSMEKGALIIDMLKEFQHTFDNATIVNDAWIEQYREIYNEEKALKKQGKELLENNLIYIKKVSPNKMQVEALRSLEELRNDGKNKALLISATGTGKTYLSAFDVKKFEPKKFLFVVHRENIARAAMRSYKYVFGDSRKMGILCGNSKDIEADFIFSTIQTLSKEEILSKFAKDHFDYIVIDEVHRSGATTYQKILDYFTPKFLLGMSATPERTDGFNIYKIFDYNIAYEIRLNRALAENMLVPFHYYGVSDMFIDGQVVDDKTEFNKLVSEERVNKIISVATEYGCDSGRIKGLIFCSRKDEAHELSYEFNLRGYNTIALDGESSEELREQSISRLETDNSEDKLDYIFTVDIFNEGVDIPAINQIIMLRPTQSAIVFVQQLGRGLRKADNKEYLTVIDFIGNYSNNYLVPIALYGDSSYSKDNIRKLLNSGSSYIPGSSTVNFDLISRERIYNAIDVSNFSKKKDLETDYNLLKYKIGKIPTMVDFVEHGSRDPIAYIDYAGSYFAFISKIEDELMYILDTSELELLRFYSSEFAPAKRVEELELLSVLIEKGHTTWQELHEIIKDKYGYFVDTDTLLALGNTLNGDFYGKGKKYETVSCLEDRFVIGEQLQNALMNNKFKYYLEDSIDYGINKFKRIYNANNFNEGFILYQKYSRRDVCRILNWSKNEESTMYGYRIKNGTCPIFVTYKKSEDISESTKYEEAFVNSKQFSWMTRARVTLESSEIRELKNYKNGLRILLFIKKSDDEGNDFYYMGDMEPYEYFQKTIEDGKGRYLPIVNVRFNMLQPVDDNMINYLEDK